MARVVLLATVLSAAIMCGGAAAAGVVPAGALAATPPHSSPSRPYGGTTTPARGPRAPVLTVRSCISAWNSSASTGLRAVLARNGSGVVSITIGIGASQFQPRPLPNATWLTGCTVEFASPSGARLAFWGAWHNGAVPAWRGPYASSQAKLRADASVAARGTVALLPR